MRARFGKSESKAQKHEGEAQKRKARERKGKARNHETPKVFGWAPPEGDETRYLQLYLRGPCDNQVGNSKETGHQQLRHLGLEDDRVA